MNMTGHCLCGSVKLRTDAAPIKAMHCHCSMCRRHSGAAFLTYVLFPASAVHFTGKPPVAYKSSDVARRSHCGTCGSPVSFVYETEPENIYIPVGILDQAASVAPQEHWYADCMLPWLHLDDRLPRHETLPNS